MVEFQCWGLEPIDFQPQVGFVAEGLESDTVFCDSNLQERVKESVGIIQVTHQFVNC